MSKQKQKGTSFETLVVRFLRDNGFQHAERRVLHGTADKGDITGCPGLVWECKNHKTLRLGEWMRETETERVNADADFGVLVVKRFGVGEPAGQYAVVTLEDMCRLLMLAGYGKK
jgi:hypothetical protein